MSVTMSRFVNVMSGGRVAKDWHEKPLIKKNAKIVAALGGMKADLDWAKEMGLTVKPDVLKLYDGMEREFTNAGSGKSPAKWLEAEDRLLKNASRAAAALRKFVADAEPAAEKAMMVNAIGADHFDTSLKETAAQIKKIGARVDVLSEAEIVAIRIYTQWKPPDYEDMNKMYRGEAVTGDPAKIRAKIKVLEKAMSKLPVYTATQPTNRLDKGPPGWPGWPKIYAGYNVGSEMTVAAFWSTGKTGTINSSAKGKIFWTVYGGSGRDIDALSQLKGEGGGEVLYPPNARFKVESTSFEEDPDGETKTWRLTVREVVP
jgi:hypothetical protein